MPQFSFTTEEVAALAQQLAPYLADTLKASPREQPRKLTWNEKEAADVLGVSPHTLKKWRGDGLIKSHTRIKPILYRWQDIEAIADWMAKRTHQ